MPWRVRHTEVSVHLPTSDIMITAFAVSPFALCIVIMLALSFSCSNLSDAVDTAEIRPPILEHSVDEIYPQGT